MEKLKIAIDKDSCVGCGLCVKICAAHNIRLENNKAQPISDNCIFCGHCSAVCPNHAVSIVGNDEESVEKSGEIRLDPQKVLEAIRFRRSVRKFQNKEIPSEIIEQILEAGRLTHTAKNIQDVSFAVLDKEKDGIERIAVRLFRKLKPLANMFSPIARRNKIDDNFFFFKAPIAIVIFANDKTDGILAA